MNETLNRHGLPRLAFPEIDAMHRRWKAEKVAQRTAKQAQLDAKATEMQRYFKCLRAIR